MQPPQPPPSVSPAGTPSQPQQRKLQLEIPANLTATYANMVIISQMHSELVLDFVQVLPNDPRARVLSRIVMTPANAKLFMRALTTNLERFEQAHGEISLPPQPPSLADQLFGSIKADEDKDSSPS